MVCGSQSLPTASTDTQGHEALSHTDHQHAGMLLYTCNVDTQLGQNLDVHQFVTDIISESDGI